MKFDSCVGSVNGVLVWFGSTFVDLANAQWRYIAYPSMYAACFEDHFRGTRTFFLKTAACRSILAFYPFDVPLNFKKNKVFRYVAFIAL